MGIKPVSYTHLDVYKRQGENKIDKNGKNDVLIDATYEVYSKVNEDLVQDVINSKIKYGEYFDHKFLKIAAELILLEEDARGNKQIRGYTATMFTRLDYFLDNHDCEFMRESNGINTVKKYISELWNTIGDNNKSQLVIIDTSELSPDILETLTSVTARVLFDQRKKLIGDDRRKNPIHLILDEAHRYIKKHYEYLLKENIFEKIAREGRKYSLFPVSYTHLDVYKRQQLSIPTAPTAMNGNNARRYLSV